jgi:hypothetical protein
MTIIAHSNTFAHRMLTDQGAFVHEHNPETFEDVGDAENGPQLVGGPAFDCYEGDSHSLIIDHTGLIVFEQEIDWDEVRFGMTMPDYDYGESEGPQQYVRPYKVGEDFRVTFTDEDGPWYACRGYGWTDNIKEAAWYTRSQAEQVAFTFNSASGRRDDRITGSAYII